MNRHAPKREERRKNMTDPELKDETATDLAHGYARHLARIHGDDSLSSSAVNVCQNCGATHGYIEEIWTDDGRKPLLCEDCAEEVRRMEKRADELAAALGCPERQQILDTVDTTVGLVNRLRAHDMAQCAACASARASVATECQIPHPSAAKARWRSRGGVRSTYQSFSVRTVPRSRVSRDEVPAALQARRTR
jgi:hypothetical protein